MGHYVGIRQPPTIKEKARKTGLFGTLEHQAGRLEPRFKTGALNRSAIPPRLISLAFFVGLRSNFGPLLPFCYRSASKNPAFAPSVARRQLSRSHLPAFPA